MKELDQKLKDFSQMQFGTVQEMLGEDAPVNLEKRIHQSDSTETKTEIRKLKRCNHLQRNSLPKKNCQ